MAPRITIKLSTDRPTVGKSFTAQALGPNGDPPKGTVRFGFSDPDMLSYESVSKAKIRIRPLKAGLLRIDATETRTGADASGYVDIVITDVAPAPEPEPEPEPEPMLRIPLILVRMNDEPSGSALFHTAVTFRPNDMPLDWLPRLQLVDSAGSPIPIAEPKATALHLDGQSARAVLLQGWYNLPDRDIEVPVWLEVLPEGTTPARRQAEDVSAIFMPSSSDDQAAMKRAGCPPAIIWHATPEQGCASRPFDFPMVPRSEYPLAEADPADLRIFAERWRSLAPGKFNNWTGDYHGMLQYDRPFLHVVEALQTHDWSMLRMGMAYAMRYANVFPPNAAPSPQYMNVDTPGMLALLFDVEQARAFILREAEIAYRWLARDDYADRMWVRNGWSDGDFRPAERRFKQLRWASMLSIPTTVGMTWEEAYYKGMRGLKTAEQWVHEPDGALRYTHKSVGRYDATTKQGPTPVFMLGLIITETTISAVETFGDRMPEDCRQVADELLWGTSLFFLSVRYPSQRKLSAILYYSDEVPGELKPWHETEPKEEDKRWKDPAVNLNAYVILALTVAAHRFNDARLLEAARALQRALAGDYFDGHGGPYFDKFTGVHHKVYNQSRMTTDRAVWYFSLMQ